MNQFTLDIISENRHYSWILWFWCGWVNKYANIPNNQISTSFNMLIPIKIVHLLKLIRKYIILHLNANWTSDKVNEIYCHFYFERLFCGVSRKCTKFMSISIRQISWSGNISSHSVDKNSRDFFSMEHRQKTQTNKQTKNRNISSNSNHTEATGKTLNKSSLILVSMHKCVGIYQWMFLALLHFDGFLTVSYFGQQETKTMKTKR